MRMWLCGELDDYELFRKQVGMDRFGPGPVNKQCPNCGREVVAGQRQAVFQRDDLVEFIYHAACVEVDEDGWMVQ